MYRHVDGPVLGVKYDVTVPIYPSSSLQTDDHAHLSLRTQLDSRKRDRRASILIPTYS